VRGITATATAKNFVTLCVILQCYNTAGILTWRDGVSLVNSSAELEHWSPQQTNECNVLSVPTTECLFRRVEPFTLCTIYCIQHCLAAGRQKRSSCLERPQRCSKRPAQAGFGCDCCDSEAGTVAVASTVMWRL